MITPILEKHILNGEGKFRTWPIFYSPTAKIPVPKDKFIVITDLDIWPAVLLEFPNDDPQRTVKIDRYSIMQLDMFSKGMLRNSLLIRSDWKAETNAADGKLYLRNGSKVHFDLLQVAENDVYFSVLRFQGVQQNGGMDQTALSNSQIPAPNVSYGTLFPTLKQLVTEDGAVIEQNGNDESGSVVGTSYRSNATVQAKFNAIVPMPDPLQDWNWNHFIINVSFIEFNIKTLKNFGN